MFKSFSISGMALSVFLMMTAGAYANEIISVQSAACSQGKKDCTRIMFTMKESPKFSVFKSKDDGTEYKVVLHDISDPARKTGPISIKSSSVIANVIINRTPKGTSDQVHYFFPLKKSVVPRVNKSGNSFWVDFPHQDSMSPASAAQASRDPGAAKNGESSASKRNEFGKPGNQKPGDRGTVTDTRKPAASGNEIEKLDRKEAERRLAEKREAEKKEAERILAEKREAERKEAERKLAEKREAERKEAERILAEKREAEKRAAEKKEAERILAEKQAAERKEAERILAEKREAERKEAERILAGKREAEKKDSHPAGKNNEAGSPGRNSRNSKDVRDIRELENELFADLNSEGDNQAPTESLEKRLAAPEPPKPTAYKRKSSATCTVVVDPGHGGKDPGAIGVGNVQEKAVTLGISRSLVAYLNSDPLLEGKLTRNRDIFIELGRRSQIARNNKANFLISIHADSALNSQAQGASVLVLNRDRANRENSKSVQNTDNTKMLAGLGEFLKDHNDPLLQQVAVDMASNTSRSDGNDLAKEILGSMGRIATLHKSVPINRSLAVLKAPDSPSLLIETGYLSNPDEASLLATGKYQRTIAHAIYLGIKNFVYKNKDTLRCGVAAQSEPRAPARSNKPASSGAKPAAPGKTVIYVVKKGDTLSKIAQDHKVSPQHLKQLNGLARDQVNAGQRLKVPKKK